MGRRIEEQLKLEQVPVDSWALAVRRTHPYVHKLGFMLMGGQPDAMEHVIASAYLQGTFDGYCTRLHQEEKERQAQTMVGFEVITK